jgi:hypothetical protein
MAKRMDRKLLSKQGHEIAHVAKKTGKSRATVRTTQKTVGRSRRKVMAALLPR